MLAGFQGLGGNFEMSGIGGRNYHQANRCVAEQSLDVANHLGMRVSLSRLFAAALHDVSEPQVWIRMNQRRMEYLSGHSEANETNVNGIRHADILRQSCLQKALSGGHEGAIIRLLLTSLHEGIFHGAGQSLAQNL